MTLEHLYSKTLTHVQPDAILEGIDAELAFRKFGEAHTIAEIVAHVDYWQQWWLKRIDGIAQPMASSAAEGWPAPQPQEWNSLVARYIFGYRAADQVACDPARHQVPLDPPIEFPPLAEYTVADALIHIAQHNSHHMGQIVTLRQIAGSWPPPSGSMTW